MCVPECPCASLIHPFSPCELYHKPLLGGVPLEPNFGHGIFSIGILLKNSENDILVPVDPASPPPYNPGWITPVHLIPKLEPLLGEHS